MKFDQRPEGGEATNHVATSEKVLVREISSRRARKCGCLGVSEEEDTGRGDPGRRSKVKGGTGEEGLEPGSEQRTDPFLN